MRGSKLAEAIVAAVDRIVSACKGSCTLDRAIKAIIGTIGRFSGQDATSYLDSYRAEMVMRDISEDKRLVGSPQVVTPGIHAEVLEVQVRCRTWGEFEAQLLERYGLDNVLQLSKQDFMEWVETPRKGRNASALLREFEEYFVRLSALDWTILDTSRILQFVKAVDVRDREQVVLLLETDDGLTTDWTMVKRVCARFDKRHEWGGKDSSLARLVLARKFDELSPARKEETRDWHERGSPLTGVPKGPLVEQPWKN